MDSYEGRANRVNEIDARPMSSQMGRTPGNPSKINMEMLRLAENLDSLEAIVGELRDTTEPVRGSYTFPMAPGDDSGEEKARDGESSQVVRRLEGMNTRLERLRSLVSQTIHELEV